MNTKKGSSTKTSSTDKLKKLIDKGFKGKVKFSKTNNGELIALVDKAHIVDFSRFLKRTKDLEFNYLKCLFGVDKEKHLEVIYLPRSISKNLDLIVKVLLPKKEAKIDTVTSVWRAANWYERETSEMYGITFEGHPDPRKLILMDEFKGFPLRKEFLLPDERKDSPMPAKWS